MSKQRRSFPSNPPPANSEDLSEESLRLLFVTAFPPLARSEHLRQQIAERISRGRGRPPCRQHGWRLFLRWAPAAIAAIAVALAFRSLTPSLPERGGVPRPAPSS